MVLRREYTLKPVEVNVLKAVVMAGGRGSRLRVNYEKPLVPLCGKPMIEWVIESLTMTSSVSEVYVAVSRNTPNTKRWCMSRGFNVVETRGSGLPYDIVEAVSMVGGEALTVMADLPLISPLTIEMVIEVYRDLIHHSSTKLKVLTLVTLVEEFRKYANPSSITPYTYLGVTFQPTGISIFNLKGEVEVVVVAGFRRDFINVNTIDELRVVERILCSKYMEEMYGY
ncbi:MAG TPA: hypothetical protein EYH40_00965 [Desulfurococcales archaeon]|nr:hypothetical protein [Desulfurococcales archaeon]